MSSKKELAALRSEAPQPPLRRGRGLRLSRASKQARELVPKPPALPEPSMSPAPATLPETSHLAALPAAGAAIGSTAAAETPIAPDAVAAEAGLVAAAPVESPISAYPESPKPVREKRKIQLRKDLLKQGKRIARAQDRKLYQVIESALEEYIQRHGVPE
jgi:hypothetical protein